MGYKMKQKKLKKCQLDGHFVMAALYSKFPINIELKIYFDIVQIIPSAYLLQIKFDLRQKKI